MAKNSKTKYNFSGNYEDYKALLRNFTLDKLITRINIESAKIMINPENEICYGVIQASYHITNLRNLSKISQNVFVTGWNLIDLSYNAIISSNDFRGKEIENDEELYLLVSAMENVREKRESEFINSLSEDDITELLLYLWGFTGEQLKVETLSKVPINASRELYILFESSKNVEGISDIADIVIKETGIDWETVITSLYLAWFGSILNPNIMELEQNIKWDNGLNHEAFNKVIERYTTTYEEIRGSELGRQYLYTKPFVKTQHNDLLSVNCFLNLFLYEHCILWIVRDYYRHQDNQIFTSEFGRCFEAYFKELLEDYLEPEEFSRIPEENTKRADWKIQIGDYKFLIEQKSTVLGLTAKQQKSNIETIKIFSNRHIIKALHQLENTELGFNDGKYIKIVLIYEDYLQTEMLENVFSMKSCDIKNDYYFWLVTIEEIEMLLYICKHDRKLFYDVISEKVKREFEKAKNGRSLQKILNEKGIESNQHLKQKKFLKYERLAIDNALKYLWT
ncbi:MAG: hypothetical protein VB018_13380 [Lachnospiraceae bacterium]|nr:hypothetical protein [Lachnospiraceae bacterium]